VTPRRICSHLTVLLGVAVLLVAACTPPTAAPARPAGDSSAARATAASQPASPPAAVASAAASQQELPSTPTVDLKVGVLSIASYAPIFIALHRGYFQELGLNVELVPTSNITEQLPSVAQGQLQVAACAASVPCYNGLNRRIDVQIVADLISAGKTEKSRGSNALVVRKDLWDAGTIREPKDLVGRSVYLIPGPGAGHHAATARWLQRNGLDPQSVEWAALPGYADLLAAMENRGVELGVQTEPLLTAGLSRGAYQSLAPIEEMDPDYQSLYLIFWSGIDRLGPRVGERFMVAFLRGARAYLNAFEYGVDQEPIIDILTQETVIKDPAVYRRIKYGWVDPNGQPVRATIEAYADLFRELGVLNAPIDLSGAFEDKYRQAAVQYLGDYRPPQ
jgi:NitT/TauT family transport system substrate-binding protein